MKIRSQFNVSVYRASYLTVLLTLLTVVPAWSAPTMSQELKMTIMNRMSIAGERGMVLKSTARAIENGYPEDRLSPIIERSLDNGVSGDALSRMIETLDEAHVRKLPTQPYAEKIMEGLAKRVNEDRILAALARVGRRMEFAGAQARRVDRKNLSSQILVIRTSDAIAAGMDRRTLERVFDVMAHERVNRKIEPEDIMEMVKAASGYGVDSRSVGDFAVSLMKSRKSDLSDIRRYLEELSGNAYKRGSDGDKDDITQRHSDDAEDDAEDDDGEEEGEEEGDDDDGEEDGEEGAGGDDPGDDEPEDDESEDDESEDDEPEDDEPEDDEPEDDEPDEEEKP